MNNGLVVINNNSQETVNLILINATNRIHFTGGTLHGVLVGVNDEFGKIMIYLGGNWRNYE
jgi:hypothetical protein